MIFPMVVVSVGHLVLHFTWRPQAVPSALENIWRFPTLAKDDGGKAFVILYLIALVVV